MDKEIQLRKISQKFYQLKLVIEHTNQYIIEINKLWLDLYEERDDV